MQMETRVRLLERFEGAGPCQDRDVRMDSFFQSCRLQRGTIVDNLHE